MSEVCEIPGARTTFLGNKGHKLRRMRTNGASNLLNRNSPWRVGGEVDDLGALKATVRAAFTHSRLRKAISIVHNTA